MIKVGDQIRDQIRREILKIEDQLYIKSYSRFKLWIQFTKGDELLDQISAQMWNQIIWRAGRARAPRRPASARRWGFWRRPVLRQEVC